MPFPARFAGQCAKCNQPIKVGQFIGWSRRVDQSGKKIWHVDCANPDAKPEPESTPEPTQAKPSVQGDGSNAIVALASAILPLIQGDLNGKVDRAQVEAIAREIVESELAGMDEPVQTIEVTRMDTGSTVNVGTAHVRFPMLLKILSAHTNKTPINVWLTGPAGSGKTHAAHQASQALGLNFYFSGAIQEPYSLLGYKDANGNTVRTAFREAYEHGGVFLQDEIDGSNANALLSFNAALANGHCAFPDSVVPRHKDCIIIAAANTFGLGGNSDYVGRVKLDAASLSRYVWLDWPYDEKLERSLATHKEWAELVIKLRNRAHVLGLRVLITPRATYAGDALLSAGIPVNEVEKMVIRQGMSEDQWKQISQ